MEERTTPMRQQGWSQNADEQETVFADQDNPTPPTLPFGDQSGPPPFVRSEPASGTPSPPFAPTPPPPPPQPGPPPFQPVAPAAEGQTMIIAERPKPVFAWLVVVDGPDRNSIGTVHSLRPETTTIGRVTGNNIIIHDATCSAQHARIRIETNDEDETLYVLYDMGSSNGTYIGDKETYKDEENRKYRHELQDGDYILIGETTLVFKRL